MFSSTRCVALATAVATMTAAATGVHAAGPYDGWKPHNYCNDLEQMESMKIEPLNAEQAALVESLEQVQIIARHGARAPYFRVFCWDTKKNNPMNAHWNCSTVSVSNQDVGYDSARGYGRLYRKNYMEGLNSLSGNCVVGGLLPLGRQQQLKNGLILRDAYIGDGPLKLFPTANLSHVPIEQIYLRSDDQERTLGSGQALMDGLFPVDDSLSQNIEHMLEWNVADYKSDHINSNANICPLMDYIGNLSNNAQTFLEHNRNPHVVQIEHDFNATVGNFSWDTVLECLSTARCNNLPLPHGIDETQFINVYANVEERQRLFLTYNNSWYAKIAMQPLLHEIITRLDAVVNGTTPTPKLAVTMGHDSTIMPFMAAIVKSNWDGKWTPYAGVLTMEIYKLKTKASFGVRMLFQGKPVLIPECKDTLCTLDEFEDAIAFGRHHRNCTSPIAKKSTPPSELATTTTATTTHLSFSQYVSAAILIGLVALTAVLALRQRHARNRRGWGDEGTTLLG